MREERVRNRTKNGRVRSLREERVRNRTKAGGVRSLRQERVRIRGRSKGGSTSLKNISTGHPDTAFSLIGIDEITRVLLLNFQLFLLKLAPFINDSTVLALLGDPAQTTVSWKMLPSSERWLASNHDVDCTIMHWLLYRIERENPDLRTIVDKVDLLNRDLPSSRCLPPTAALVSSLAPLCLPAYRDGQL